ncbi:MAG: tandem-95 repeat protein, partial [Akkermansiaceae bacterium]|nr:tandem-95 repeat protein [Akkermansiaceae bacterium]
SALATVTIDVTPVNDTPIADGQTDVPVVEDTATAITLTGSDVDGDSLTYTVVDAPTNGALSGTAPNLTYTPAADYTGADSFTFLVNDGTEDSALATVTIDVTPVNDIPVANAQPSVSVDENGSVPITLTGSDVDGDSLTFTVVGGPAHGALSGTAPDLTYTPATDYFGPDSFTFVANDGTVDSAPAEVTITVNEVAGDGWEEWLTENGITGAGAGVDSDDDSISNAVEYVIGGNPAGQNDTGLLPTAATVLADPDNDTNNSPYLVFTYRRTDRANDDPLVTIGVQWSTSLTGSWSAATDGVDGVVILTDDNHYEAGIDRVRVYIPRSLAVNGKLFARLGVEIDASSSIVAPQADDQSVSVDEDGSVAITLTGTDSNGDPLTYAVVSGPSHGTLTGTAPNLVYTPDEDYFGADSFLFTANDGGLDSPPATVSITVNPLEEFAQFMSSYGLTAGPNVDSDGDTILNSVEFVIGGNPANQANQNLLPFVSYVTADPDNNTVFDNYLLFTYRRTDDANTDPSTDIRVEWNAYLSGPWTNATDTPGTVVLETDDHYGAGVDRVQVYIPRSASPNGFMFTRFRVTVATP